MAKSILIVIVIAALFGVGYWAMTQQDDPQVAEEERVEVSLYYYNPSLDQDATGNVQCSREGLVAVTRSVEPSENAEELAERAIRQLISGELTDAERESGIQTEFPLAGFALTNATLRDGTLTLEFADSQNRTVGGACRVGVLWFQIEQTESNLPQVSRVQFVPEALF